MFTAPGPTVITALQCQGGPATTLLYIYGQVRTQLSATLCVYVFNNGMCVPCQPLHFQHQFIGRAEGWDFVTPTAHSHCGRHHNAADVPLLSREQPTMRVMMTLYGNESRDHWGRGTQTKNKGYKERVTPYVADVLISLYHYLNVCVNLLIRVSKIKSLRHALNPLRIKLSQKHVFFIFPDK